MRVMLLLCDLLIPNKGNEVTVAYLDWYFSPVDVYPAVCGDYNLRALLPPLCSNFEQITFIINGE